MKDSAFISQRLALLFAAAVAFLPFLTQSAEMKVVRIAIGPFSAPPLNDELRQASQLIPALLASELSHSSRFQLVEREKTQGVWNELNLSAAALVAKENVAKLGHILACDWVISGSLVQAEGRTHVWTKVIDVRDAVVLDLDATPYEAGVATNVASRIAKFIDRAGTQQTKAKAFVTMGQFIDMSPPLMSKREDWSRRLVTLIEKNSLEAGYGVAELAAVGPIFEERRLEKAGLTGNPAGRVKLQPAFWLVDGGCEWVGGDSLRLAVALRVQRVGGPEQMFRFTNSPNEAIEKESLAVLARALANTNLNAQTNSNAEADLLAARGMEMATRSSPFQPRQRRTQGSTQWDNYKRMLERSKQHKEHLAVMTANYERVLLRDPDNMEAKTMLAYSWIANGEPDSQQRGLQALREVEANQKAPKWAAQAHRLLSDSNALNQMLTNSRNVPTRPKDWDSLNQAYEEEPSNLEFKCDLGAALRNLPRLSDRERGKQMLAEVAASGDSDQAERARKLLAEPDKYPAVPEIQHPTGYVSPEDAYEARLEEELKNEDPVAAARRKYLQKNFERFLPVQFVSDGIDSARIQRLRAQESKFDYEGKQYCGFRFVVPPWLDGDLTWMQVFERTDAQKDLVVEGFEWYIVPKSGKMVGFENFQTLEVEKYPELKQRFPHTEQMYCQYLPQRRLKAGQEYAIWFSFEQKEFPNIAFALTISSNRGRKEIGGLPVR